LKDWSFCIKILLIAYSLLPQSSRICKSFPSTQIFGFILLKPFGNAWLRVPYRYIVETNRPGNAGLMFKVVGGVLPDGLTLLPGGAFHGAPMETGVFTFDVEVRDLAFNYLLDIQEIKLTAPPDIVADPVAEANAGGAADSESADAAQEANERITFVLDGSGAPFELRIDIPLAEFRGLSFDGVPWEQGTDYTAREGSTILTIAAERLAGFAAGVHRISAVFENETVDIEFLLQKSESAVADNGTGATAPASAEDTPAKSPGAGTIAAIALAVILILAAAFAILRSRRRAAA
jgi:hypothetical protein